MSWLKNPKVPVIITSIAAILLILDYYISLDPLNTIASNLRTWNSIIMGVALFVGTVTLIRLNVTKVIKADSENWGNRLSSLVLIVTFIGIIGLYAYDGSISGPNYQWLYTTLLLPIETSLYALVGFFIAYAAYHGFRARNIESFVMLVAAIIMMFTITTYAGAVWEGLPIAGKWLNDVPGTAGSRAFLIAVSLGTIALGLRVLIGKERLLGGR